MAAKAMLKMVVSKVWKLAKLDLETGAILETKEAPDLEYWQLHLWAAQQGLDGWFIVRLEAV